MARLTSNPNDPDLGWGVDKEPSEQNKAYLVLSEEERAKGFIRPVRRSYRHVGKALPKNLRDLTEEEQERHGGYGYVKYEKYDESQSPILGRFWTQTDLDNASNGCGEITTMSSALAETYARDPSFYGATFCVHCNKHLPVEDFVWEGTEERLGS